MQALEKDLGYEPLARLSCRPQQLMQKSPKMMSQAALGEENGVPPPGREKNSLEGVISDEKTPKRPKPRLPPGPGQLRARRAYAR